MPLYNIETAEDGHLMRKLIFACISILVLAVLAGSACANTRANSRDDNKRVAEDFVKQEATYSFDGMAETLKVTGSTSVVDGWRIIIEFDSRHAGYGDRSGQMLAQVITHHAAEVTVQSGQVTTAVMDGVWDMVSQQMLDNIEIDLAPIHEVTVNYLKSNPPQISVHIKGGLRDGCTKFHDIEVTQEGNIYNIKVTTEHPKDVFCPAIYTYFEQDVNLGSNFTNGTTYTLNVNDYSTMFAY
jgi:hypothetical protein